MPKPLPIRRRCRDYFREANGVRYRLLTPAEVRKAQSESGALTHIRKMQKVDDIADYSRRRAHVQRILDHWKANPNV
jgi:hypothetical protein